MATRAADDFDAIKRRLIELRGEPSPADATARPPCNCWAGEGEQHLHDCAVMVWLRAGGAIG